MEKVRELVERELALLRELLPIDVAAVAWSGAEDRRLAWWAASGCSDDRYRTLAIRPGRGLEGTVPRIGRPLVLDAGDPGTPRRREESALMLVEGLHSAAAYPVSGEEGLCGVLLVGNRQARAYSQDHLLVVQLSARWLGQLRDYAEKGAPTPHRH
ncbi:hypothetical protein J19TS2_25520 [Cohnella xylanilytica]|uniref:GAF domain-containing protein n=1 Tax=Cohnella xylanilytica TaxID=557555 RepID=UPI001B13C784|nr:GAF domain-containing protein [Cohnella xylanilytica]GIO12997.1 hypothetical protein J19TS2_25520 [Cohnella xylanilytica]